ncbi:hypothetical protein EX465_18660, partial [Vibrio cholerae]|nr:hypothetical protein [Vibrio cholerae]
MDINDNQTSIFLVKHTDSFAKPPYNARLRGWQRITTKLKCNNCNHRGSMGPETPRVGSPFEAFVRAYFHYTLGLLIFLTHHFLCHYN